MVTNIKYVLALISQEQNYKELALYDYQDSSPPHGTVFNSQEMEW